MGTLGNITSSYSFLESWFYERFISAASLKVKYNLINSFVRYLPANAKVLDVGCGGGQVLEKLLSDSTFQGEYFGIDISPFQTQFAIERLERFHTRVTIKCASAMELPFPGERFDLVYSLACIKHWPDMNTGLKEIFRVLKPGGQLIITELDQESSLGDVKEFINYWTAPWPLRFLFKVFFSHLYLEKIVRPSIKSAQITEELNQLGITGYKVEKFPQSPAFTIKIMK